MAEMRAPKKLIEVALPLDDINQEPDWAVTSINFDLDELLRRRVS